MALNKGGNHIMRIEERLEAITQTLELTARTAHDTERRLEETMIRQGDHVARFAETCQLWIETAERRFAELQEIARANSRRLEMLEARF
jgi:hypothetical protein